MDPKQENTPPTTPQTPPAQQAAPAQQPQTPPVPAEPTPQPQPKADEPLAPTPTEQSKPETTPASSQTPPPPSQPSSPASPANDQPTPKEEKRISLRTVLLIVILAILAGILLFIALRPNKKIAVQNATPTPTTKPSQAHSTLSLVLADTSATPSGIGISTKSVNVVLTTQSNKASGVQFEIQYDPTVLTNVTVKPGDFFTNPLVLLNQVDTKNGKINYALGIQPTAQQVTGSGTVAVISYTLLPTASASETTLKFLPKTQVVQQGISGSVLEKFYDLSIPVAGLTPSATTTNSESPTTAPTQP